MKVSHYWNESENRGKSTRKIRAILERFPMKVPTIEPSEGSEGEREALERAYEGERMKRGGKGRLLRLRSCS